MRVRIPISQHGDNVDVEGVDRKTVSAPDGFHASRKLPKHIVRAGHGHAFAVSKGTQFRIVDLYGEQVVDFMAWVAPDSTTRSAPPSLPLEKVSMAYTRYHLRGVTPAVNEALYSNADRPILRITDDTVKVHDMTYMTCFPQMYEKQGLHGHRSCAQNVFEVMQEYGMRDILEVLEPFNCFQNTPNYSLKAMGSSKPGDYIEFEALENLVCAVSSCPYDVDGFNGGNITDIAVVVSEEK
jgi:uncharacterized protein YcgI (DUF1989 family)